MAFFFQAELSPYAPPIVGGPNQKSTRLDDVHAARLWPLTGPQQKAPGPIAQGSMARNPGSEYLSIAHGYRVHGLPMMDEAKQPEPIESELKESIASRIERREAEIALAMKQEAERHAAVIKNMHRLCEPCGCLKRLKLQHRSGVLKHRSQSGRNHSQRFRTNFCIVWAGVRYADL